jgi:ankyrin repeat protein
MSDLDKQLVNAITSRDVKEANRLLDEGADAKYTCPEEGMNLLHWCIMCCCDTKLIKRLIKLGADPHAKEYNNNKSAIETEKYMSREGDTQIILEILNEI